MADNLLPPQLLCKLLRYDDGSGKLFWLERGRENWQSDPLALVRWNARYAGSEALTARKSRGYRHGLIMGKTYLAHRVAWAIWTGEWPKLHIDHIDGDQENNRISNLREASRSQNMRNSRSSKGSTSAYLGVSWKSGNGKWCAQIQLPSGKKHLGYFGDEVSAAKAYDAAAAHWFGGFARVNFPTAP